MLKEMILWSNSRTHPCIYVQTGTMQHIVLIW